MSDLPAFYHISVNARRATHSTWGDTQYAEGLGRALARRTGGDWALLFRGETPERRASHDVVIRIVGPHLEEPVPGMINLLWLISPPNLAPMGMLRRYQARFCASAALAGIYPALGLATDYLPQATEISHFHPSRRKRGAAEIPLLFVGALAERADRRLVFDAIEAGFEPQIWGPGWQGKVPDRLLMGERLGYDALADTYAAARVILNCHMLRMAELGFMSNRSFDALASGAMVVSDPVRQFTAPDLPELCQAADRDALAAALGRMLAEPPLSPAARLALHKRVIARHSFDAAARVLSDAAVGLLPAPGPQTPRQGRETAPEGRAAPRLVDPAVSAPDGQTAMARAAAEILELAAHLAEADATTARPQAPAPATHQGVIHALMADQREMQQIALTGDPVAASERIRTIAAGARRVAEALADRRSPFGFRAAPARAESLLSRIKDNQPLWLHSPEGFDRDSGKRSIRLWGKRDQPAPARDIGVFLHLFHDDLAPAFAARLQLIRPAYRLYVSTDTEEKAGRIAEILPMAQIRVVPNRGRDILPKLYGFGDAYADHDIILHLHGKKSLHSGGLDDWLQHIFDALLGSQEEVNRILSFFESIPALGIVSPVAFRMVLGAAHWGANADIARELAWRMGQDRALPNDNELRFPVGSMFWGRSAAIRPLLDLRLGPAHFPPEAGQVDGTLAHALERMLGVTAVAGGYHILPVSGRNSRQHARHQLRFTSNGDLRRALDEGVLARPEDETTAN